MNKKRKDSATDSNIRSERYEMLSIDEAAAYMSMSPKTIYGWLGKHKIPYYKLGANQRSRVRINRADLDALLQQSRIESGQEA